MAVVDLRLISIRCCCWSFDTVLYQADLDFSRFTILFLPCFKLISLNVKPSRSCSFLDTLLHRHLLHRSSSVGAVQYTFNLNQLVFWDIVLHRLSGYQLQLLSDKWSACQHQIGRQGVSPVRAGCLRQQGACTSRSASKLSKPAKDPSACRFDSGSPFAAPGIAVLLSIQQRADKLGQLITPGFQVRGLISKRYLAADTVVETALHNTMSCMPVGGGREKARNQRDLTLVK